VLYGPIFKNFIPSVHIYRDGRFFWVKFHAINAVTPKNMPPSHYSFTFSTQIISIFLLYFLGLCGWRLAQDVFLLLVGPKDTGCRLIEIIAQGFDRRLSGKKIQISVWKSWLSPT